jgi:hypothetical protein
MYNKVSVPQKNFSQGAHERNSERLPDKSEDQNLNSKFVKKYLIGLNQNRQMNASSPTCGQINPGTRACRNQQRHCGLDGVYDLPRPTKNREKRQGDIGSRA